MNRLTMIKFINNSWHTQVTEFLDQHPDFKKLIPIVALDEYPTGFNKNPHEVDEDAPRNIFETIIHGLGVMHYLLFLMCIETNATPLLSQLIGLGL